MNRVWVIADTHFGHSRILEFEPEARPFSSIEEHDEEIIDRWNGVVKQRDTVWHLGDVAFGKKNINLISRLKGIKRLVLGNHDRHPELLDLFDSVHGSAVYHDCIFTHIPVHPGQFYRFRKNIHGHVHSKSLDDPRYINVSVEITGLYPALLKELV